MLRRLLFLSLIAAAATGAWACSGGDEGLGFLRLPDTLVATDGGGSGFAETAGVTVSCGG